MASANTVVRWIFLPLLVPMLSGIPSRIINLAVLFNTRDTSSLFDFSRVSPWTVLAVFINAFLQPLLAYWIAPLYKERTALIVSGVFTIFGIAGTIWLKTGFVSLVALVLGQLAGLLVVFLVIQRRRTRSALL